MKELIITLIIAMSFSLSAGHGMTKILGTNIDLSMNGHSFAGKIGEKIVYGKVYGKGHKYADLLIDNTKKTLKVQFAKTHEYFGGVILDGGKSTTIEFNRVVNTSERKAIIIDINSVEHIVYIQADGFKNNHFINPSFSTKIQGKLVKFKILEGKSCWMNSIQLVFSILGAYVH